MKKYLFILSFFTAILLIGCSDNDEPKTDSYKFETLEKICGTGKWETDKVAYFASNGQEVDIDRVLGDNVGADLGLQFSVKDGKLTEYYRPDGYFWESRASDFTFDRKTGYIYLEGSDKPFAQIISTAPDRIVLHAHYGEYIYKAMLEGYDKTDDTPDEGSYGLIEVVPAAPDAFTNLEPF